MIIAAYTLGCKVNQYETGAMEAELIRRGHTITEFSEPADIYIINTCTVTAAADQKSRQIIRRARKNAPGAVIAVCGCGAELNPEEMEAIGADLSGGSSGRMEFIEMLEGYAAGSGFARQTDTGAYGSEFEMLSPNIFEQSGSAQTAVLQGRTRAFLKIQDGCSNYCAYCIIPYARGPARSMPEDGAVGYIKKLALAEYRETVITGIEISSYGRDLNAGGLDSVLPKLLEAAGDMRLRLGSLEPGTVTRGLLDKIGRFKNLCPHFHLALQSGCDETLLRMGRTYDTERFLEACKLLRAYYPDCAITADLIVGFPGETEEEFGKTLRFMEACAFSAMHIFPYSRRKNTKAYDMQGQISNAVKKERAQRARRLAETMEREYKNAQLGRSLTVLFETEKDGLMTGHSENYQEVTARGMGLRGQIRTVKVTGIENGALYGDVGDGSEMSCM